MAEESLAAQCPQCNSMRLYRDGLRYLPNDDPIQRWLCRDCGLRFSERKANNECPTSVRNCQVCVTLQGAKNLASATETGTVAVRTENTPQEAKGKIIEYCFNLQKRNYSPETIRLNRTALQILVERGANLFDSESVLEVITKQKWGQARKRNVINAYHSFLKFNGKAAQYCSS